MKLVISLGGSLITSSLGEKLVGYVEVLKKLKREGHEIVVVCGGGEVARKYIEAGSVFTDNQGLLDLLGIMATRLNALLLIIGLGEDAHPFVLSTSEEVLERLNLGKILVCGGHEPGHSTDLRAAIIAELIGADLVINATNVDGVYDKDPRKNEDAKKLDELSYDEMLKIMAEQDLRAGGYALFDESAIKILKRSSIPLIVIDATDPEEIYRAVKGEHKGSIVR